MEEVKKRERCDENSVCTNTAGSFTCLCNEGFYGTGTFCTRGQCHNDICKKNMECNSKVELLCVCKKGFVKAAKAVDGCVPAKG